MSGTSSHGNPSMGDIARSLGVLGVIILILFGVGQLLTITPDKPTTSTVDYRTAAESSRTVADFDLLAPSTLPKGWRATSVRYEPDSWHLGVLTDEDAYIGLEQGRITETRAVERFAEGSRAAGTVVIDGATWTRRAGPDVDTTYVRRDGDLTNLVTGSAPPAEIERYISSLSAS
ncbi:MAG: DUF4245 domain-containing protein [Aeromicrobium sp.]